MLNLKWRKKHKRATNLTISNCLRALCMQKNHPFTFVVAYRPDRESSTKFANKQTLKFCSETLNLNCECKENSWPFFGIYKKCHFNSSLPTVRMTIVWDFKSFATFVCVWAHNVDGVIDWKHNVEISRMFETKMKYFQQIANYFCLVWNSIQILNQ